jgi:hypothetical protein
MDRPSAPQDLRSEGAGQGQARTVQSQVTSSVRAPRLRARLERLGLTSIGLGALTIFEAARLLRKYPEFNAIHDRGRMGQYADVNIGWAIDGGQGLMVPVVPQADQKTPQEIVEIMQRHIDAYVEGKLATADFLGGTVTISDLSATASAIFIHSSAKGSLRFSAWVANSMGQGTRRSISRWPSIINWPRGAKQHSLSANWPDGSKPMRRSNPSRYNPSRTALSASEIARLSD